MRTPLLIMSMILVLAVQAYGQGTIQLPEEVFTTPGPHVVVNGKILKAPVKMVNGALLLPMRPVFEALQAEVKWFPAAQQITATRGTTVVQLWINRKVAIIDEKEIPLATPPTLMDGTTFVPLRFPAEAFGGEVKWNGPLQTAIITIPPLGAATTPTTPTPPVTPAKTVDGGVIVGKTAEVGQILLVLDAKGDTLVRPLAAGALITRGPADGAVKPATFAELQLGDAVKFSTDANGKLTGAASTFTQVVGKIAAIANNKLMLQDGALYQLHPEVKAADAAGKALALTAIGNGREVTLRITPGTTTVWAITVPVETATTPTPPVTTKATILTVGALGYTGPVKAGDAITIQVSGTPAADSVIAKIGDVIPNVRLTEVEPGKYQKKVTIGANTNATLVPISAVMKLGAETTAEVKSTQLITIDTTAPVFNRLLPAQDTQVYERNLAIDAAFSDPGGSGVDPQAVVLKLDGVDVTKTATITDKGLSFKGQNLALGAHTIRLQMADQANNAAMAEWKVTILAVPTTAPTATLTHDAVAAVSAGKTVTFIAKLNGEPMKLEWYLGTKLLTQAPTRDAGTFTFRLAYPITAADALGENSASVRVFSDATHSQLVYAPTPVVIAGAVKAFAISSPADKSKAPAQMAVSGDAPAGASVRVTVTYSKIALLVQLKGDVYKGTVVTGADGKWTTPNFDTEVLVGRVDQYVVKAELLDAGGNITETVALTLTGK